ncbi:MAG TPA: DUF3516 domain-containing protein [Vulgatibacter sp.]|nr:DUF3516 domain-containing protein [Vulgatibacter sp.]
MSAASTAAPLTSLLPGEGAPRLDPDQVLERFVSHVTAGGLSLYEAQEEAILELLSGKHVILSTPTGSGKSLVAQALHFQALAEGKTSWYTAPIKALVNEKFFALCEAFGAENVGMLTGDASINRDAPIVCCTAEVLANLVLREEDPPVDYVVMDEFHYYGDPERGIAWQIPLIALPKATFLLMSATLGDTSAIEESLRALTGRDVSAIRGTERPVPLEFEYSERPLHEAIERLVEGGRHPVYLVNFSQRAAAEQAQNLMSVNFSTREEKERIRAELDGFRFDTPYGKELSRFVLHGIGLHHAGLLPKYRLLVERLAQGGLLKVISGTDTLGVGVNIPIRTVLFTQLCKFDGEKVGVLSVRDFLQIAGRAGRKGFDDRGWVVAQAPEHVIENLRIAEKQAANPKRKLVKKQPPTKGYAHWDAATFERLQTRPPEPLVSRFEVSHGLLLSLLQADAEREEGAQALVVAPGERIARAAAPVRARRRGSGYRRLLELVARSHGSDRLKARHKREAAARFRQLRSAGILEVVRDGGASRVRVAEGLQDDFSLHHTLSLYLLAALELLDRESPTYALDVLTLVESILENPQAILFKQLDRARGERIAELKAQGMDYEDRMAELEKVEWPKPNRDFVYQTFNAFAERHPWVGDENIHLKSIAREMYEALSGFHDYVRELGLQRSEGVLLRYLSDAYKTLVQNVPEVYRDDEVETIAAWLRQLVRGVDSSLIDEWERMQGLAPSSAPGAAAEEAPYHLADDRRGLTIRVRTELHRLLKALATRDHEEAAACVRPGWSPEEIAEAMAPYWEEHGSIDLTPDARKAHNTILTETGPRQWSAVQKIVDPEGEADWMIECSVDLWAWEDDGAPLLALERIVG